MSQESRVMCRLQETQGVYLAEGQSFDEVVIRDSAILKKAGVTPEKVADSLQKVLNSYNWFLDDDEQRVNDVLRVSGHQSKGVVFYPYDNAIHANSRDYLVFGLPNGNKSSMNSDDPTAVGDILPKTIREQCFFEGDVPYGLRPEWVIQVHNIVTEHGADIWVPIRQEVYQTVDVSAGLDNDFQGSRGIRSNPDRAIELAAGITMYFKGQEGVIVAERNLEVTPDLKVDGIPISGLANKILRGQNTFKRKEKIIR